MQFLENKAKGVKVQIIKEVQAEWEKLSDFLKLPRSTVCNLKAHLNWTPDSACRSIFERWLNGEGIVPKTWGTLIKVFKDMGYLTHSQDIALVLEQ